MDLQLSLRNGDNSREGLRVTCNLGDFFYADITTDSNATGSMIKDFILSIGKYDAIADTFKIFYSDILENQSIPVGQMTTTIVCQAAGAGSYDCIGGIGEYTQIGEFILEDGIIIPDALYVLGSSVVNIEYSTDPNDLKKVKK